MVRKTSRQSKPSGQSKTSRRPKPSRQSKSKRLKQERDTFIRVFTTLVIAVLSCILLILLLNPSVFNSDSPESAAGAGSEAAGSSRTGSSETAGSEPGYGSKTAGSEPEYGSETAGSEPEYGRASEAEDSRTGDTGADSAAENGGESRKGLGAEEPQKSKEQEQEQAAARRAGRSRLIVVIDDVGYNLDSLYPFLEIPVPISFAVLPQLAYSGESAALIAESGNELILHLPMESHNGQDPGPGTLSSDMTPAELQAVLENNIATVPGIVGINNHMGSRGTENEQIVAQVLSHAQKQSLFFLDSRTTADTVVPNLVVNYDVPFIERDVFLDNSRDKGYINNALEKGKRLAREQGYAVLIGHVRTGELAEILQEQYEHIINEGYEFATLASVVREND